MTPYSCLSLPKPLHYFISSHLCHIIFQLHLLPQISTPSVPRLPRRQKPLRLDTYKTATRDCRFRKNRFEKCRPAVVSHAERSSMILYIKGTWRTRDNTRAMALYEQRCTLIALSKKEQSILAKPCVRTRSRMKHEQLTLRNVRHFNLQRRGTGTIYVCSSLLVSDFL